MDPTAWLWGLETLGIKFGLDNIRALCAALGEPQRAFQSAIVAGTNGKGSVTAMVETGLRAAGHRVARYTSPHLSRLEERFVVHGRCIAPDALAAAAGAVRQAAVRLTAAGKLTAPPTFFEATTAIGFEAFRRAGVEIAVLEVGLGGRLDATNVVLPTAAAITSVGLDHQQWLGSTLREIAAEKAGIIKPGVPVVTGAMPDEAREVIVDICLGRGAPLVDAALTPAQATLAEGRTRFELETPRGRYGPLELALDGRHQAANAVTAVRLLETLDARGIRVPSAAIERALTDTRWPGRLELVGEGARRVLLDAAHNPDGAGALAAYLGDTWPTGVPLVFGAMADKDAPGMLAALAGRITTVVLTRPRAARAADLGALAAAARLVLDGVPQAVVPDPLAAVARARQSGCPVLVTGLIYLVGEVRAALCGADPCGRA
jgi:dihydrofolate synthase / folylpolyglutamate synthase